MQSAANPFTDYALPPIRGSDGCDGRDDAVVTTLAIGEESGSGPVVPAPTALAQVFHVSPPFRAIRFETKDRRLHPVLGGISSTRWSAWNVFTSANAGLVNELADRPALPLLRQLVPRPGTPLGPLPSLRLRVDAIVGSGSQLPTSGILSGDGRANRLIGSTAADVLLGWGGSDRIAGRGGGDLLCGGGGADRFDFSLVASGEAGETSADTITDFRGDRGDRLLIRGMGSFRGLQPFSGAAGEVRFSPGLLQADLDGDRASDWQINLLGVRELRAEWLLAASP
jgi:hypothetical protein